MAKRKGLSFDEKRQKMLHIFHHTQDVFNFKEVEKLSVAAGIAFPTVKEVLDSLRADDLVYSDKIGSGNYFWAFPSIGAQVLSDKAKQKAQKEVDLLNQRSHLQLSIEKAQLGRERTKEYAELQQVLRDRLQESGRLQKEVEQFRRTDPRAIAEKQKQLCRVQRQLNFWTDNCFQVAKQIKQLSPGISAQQLEEAYQLGEWDYYD